MEHNEGQESHYDKVKGVIKLKGVGVGISSQTNADC